MKTFTIAADTEVLKDFITKNIKGHNDDSLFIFISKTECILKTTSDELIEELNSHFDLTPRRDKQYSLHFSNVECMGNVMLFDQLDV